MEYVALKDVCKINMGQSPDSSSYNDKKEGIPFYQGNADFGEKHPIPRVWCNAPTKIAQPKDILMSVRAPIGALNYAQEKCCIGRGLATITPDKDKLSLEFLYWFLRGKNSELNSKGTGSTFKAISKKTLEEVRVPLIDLEKQQKMAQALEKTYSVIQMRTKQLKELDDLIKARFVEMFGEDIKQSNMTIADIAEETTVGIANSATHAYSKSGVVMLRNQNIRVNYLDDRDLIYIKQDFAEKYKNKALHEGDILVTRTGANVGMACIVPKKYEGCQTFTTLILRLRKDISISPIFVCHYINSPLGKSFVDENKIGGGQPNFGAKQLSIMPIVVPSEEKQIAFDLFVNQVDKSKLLSGCRLFHSWAPENRDKPKHVGVPQRKTKVLRGCQRQQ